MRPTINGRVLYCRVPIRYRKLYVANELIKQFRFAEAALLRATFVKQMLDPTFPTSDYLIIDI